MAGTAGRPKSPDRLFELLRGDVTYLAAAATREQKAALTGQDPRKYADSEWADTDEARQRENERQRNARTRPRWVDVGDSSCDWHLIGSDELGCVTGPAARTPAESPQSPDALRRARRRSLGEQDSTCRASFRCQRRRSVMASCGHPDSSSSHRTCRRTRGQGPRPHPRRTARTVKKVRELGRSAIANRAEGLASAYRGAAGSGSLDHPKRLGGVCGKRSSPRGSTIGLSYDGLACRRTRCGAARVALEDALEDPFERGRIEA